MEEMRLQKYLAQCGVASRRAAEQLIREGKICVNGKTVTEMGVKVKPGDKVIYSKYAGNEVKLEGEEYIIVRQNDILAVVE